MPGGLPGGAAVCAPRRGSRRRPVDDEPAHRERRLSHVQRGLFAGGLCAFRLVLRPLGLAIALFRIFGQNALAAYIIHPMVAGAVKPYLPNDAPPGIVAAGFSVYFGICTLLNRYLEKHELFLKLMRSDSRSCRSRYRSSDRPRQCVRRATASIAVHPCTGQHLVLKLELAVLAHLLGVVESVSAGSPRASPGQ